MLLLLPHGSISPIPTKIEAKKMQESSMVTKAPLGKKAVTALVTAVAVLMLLQASYSLPVPHGIDGTIYELDGVTEVRSGIDFYVHNMNNGQIIYGKTGHGSSGRYSVSISGTNGDTIIVKAWNKYNQVNVTLALNGVMRNVDLLLNMTYPPLPPNITSEPVTTATEDKLYTYDVEAYDENEDVLEYVLIEAPTGMKINSSTGLIEWVPLQKHVGNNYVVVQVSDGEFLINQSFAVVVENVNDKPRIISLPIENATEDVGYFYDVDAIDEDGDALTYYLVQKPSGMAINSENGLINWTPSNSQVGANRVVVEVSDGSLADRQEFTIFVSNVNDLPVITSVPVTSAVQGEHYTYDVEAYDIDNSVLNYSLGTNPVGMEIDNNGMITWLPDNDDVGVHNITVIVSDNDGFVVQPYALVVENVNDKPVINSTPVTHATVGKKYVYDVEAYDIDNDALVYSLLVFPEKMKIERDTGRITWKPKGNDIGNSTVIVEVSDGSLADRQEFTIVVSAPKSRRGDNNGGVSGRESSSATKAGVFAEDFGKLKIAIKVPQHVALKVEELHRRPRGVDRISKIVYKYLRIGAMEGGTIGKAIINFTVDVGWLDENKIEYDKIVLSRYTENGWVDLPTENLSKDSRFVYYTAKTHGFSYFAITVKDGVVVNNLKYDVSAIKVPYRIFGTIYKFGKFREADFGTRFTIENLNTSEVFEGTTGIGPHTGAYFALVYGNEGDLIKIKIEPLMGEFLTTLRDIDNLDFMIKSDGSGFARVTGYATAPVGMPKIQKKHLIAALLIFIICAIIFIKFKYDER
jgi:PGF-pre-PGF domain-containing protein